MANEILQKEREKSQSKLAKKSSTIDRIYKTKKLAKVPQYQHILLFRQAKSLAEDHPLYNKMWYGYLVLALLFGKYLFRQRESVSSVDPNAIGLFSFLILLWSLRYTVVYSFECILNDSFKLISQQIRLKSLSDWLYIILAVVTFNAKN